MNEWIAPLQSILQRITRDLCTTDGSTTLLRCMRLTNTAAREVPSALKLSNDRQNRIVAAQATCSAEVRQSVAEFVSSGMRRSEICQSQGFAFRTLGRHLNKPHSK